MAKKLGRVDIILGVVQVSRDQILALSRPPLVIKSDILAYPPYGTEGGVEVNMIDVTNYPFLSLMLCMPFMMNLNNFILQADHDVVYSDS